MVRPSANWDETDDGYKIGGLRVCIEPVHVYADDRVMSERAVSRDAENAYAVLCIQGVPRHQSPVVLARFADERPAWEFANLLTRYIDEVPNADIAMMNLQGSALGESDTDSLPAVIDEMDAETALRTKLGHYEFQIDDLLNSEE